MEKYNGVKVTKINSIEGDAHQDGAIGYAIAETKKSIYIDDSDIRLLVVCWDDNPMIPVCITSNRLDISNGRKDIELPKEGYHSTILELADQGFFTMYNEEYEQKQSL